MSDPWRAPTPEGGRPPIPSELLAVWAAAGAVLGADLGIALHAFEWVAGWTLYLSVLGALGFAVLGHWVWRMERAESAERPAVYGSRGELEVPIHISAWAPALVVLIPGLVALGVLGALASLSIIPLVFFGGGAVATSFGTLRLWARHKLTTGLQLLVLDRQEEAIQALVAVARHPLVSTAVRRGARENLGRVALSRGDVAGAVNWFSQAGTGAGALVGLSLAHALGGQDEVALATLQRALAHPSAPVVQSELDGVRLLLVWRTEGPEEARALAARIGTGGALFAALSARLAGEALPEGLSAGLCNLPELT